MRIKQGGHNFPEPDIRRRFYRGFDNLFQLYLPRVDAAYLYDASVLPPQLVWKSDTGGETTIDETTWRSIIGQTKEVK